MKWKKALEKFEALSPAKSHPLQKEQGSVQNRAEPLVAEKDIVAQWEMERKQRVAEQERLATIQIEEKRTGEIQAFKANIQQVSMIKDVGNIVEIAVSYKDPVSSKSRFLESRSYEDNENDLFGIFSALKNKVPQGTHSKDYPMVINGNTITLKVELKVGDSYVRVISGGNYDFMDGTSKGYYLNISLANNDEVLLMMLVKICKKLGFVFWSSPNSATGFLPQNNISLQEQVRLLEKASTAVIEQLAN
jgi:hypothetical protein